MAKRTLKTVSEVVDALGGPSVVAEQFNIGQSAVSNWNMRNEIPPGWHLRIYLRIRRLGLDVDPGVFGLDSLDELERQPPHGGRRKLSKPHARALAS